MNSIEIAWIAGLLEGEGCFSICNGSPRIDLGMTDKDVIDKARRIVGMGGLVTSSTRSKPRRNIYRFSICGEQAIEIMTLIRPHMGARRGEVIDKAISDYNLKPRVIKRNLMMVGQR